MTETDESGSSSAASRHDAPAGATQPARRLSRRVVLAAGAALVAGGAVGAYFAIRQDAPSDPTTDAGAGAPVALEFKDATGRMHSLADFRGKAVVLNLWATWCVPCREEMPTLDRLEAMLGGEDFRVVAVSVDRRGIDRVADFLKEIGTRHLTAYLADMQVVRAAIGVFGLPATLLIDRNGREVHRVVGPAEWDSPEMIAMIRERLDLAGPSPGSEGARP